MNYNYQIITLKEEDELINLFSGWDGEDKIQIIEVNLDTQKEYRFYINELKENNELKEYSLPRYEDYRLSFIRIKKWIKNNHPELII
jgi:hypothetical protein